MKGKEVKKQRTFCVGDIHGANRALVQVLERSGFDKSKDILISLGDIADGWSEVSECVDTLKSIMRLVPIRGNHDVWCHDWFERGWTPIIWTQQGGQATIDSYIRTGKITDPIHKDFWKNQVDWYIDDENRLFIHGGWDYRYLPFPRGAKLSVNAGSIARECHWDRSILQGAMSAFGINGEKKGKFKATEEFKEVYIGHTAMNGGPYQFGNLWNMDSGAGWHGYLSIMDVDTKEIWKSDLCSELYPEEKGRG